MIRAFLVWTCLYEINLLVLLHANQVDVFNSFVLEVSCSLDCMY